jgi:hypothetical protein
MTVTLHFSNGRREFTNVTAFYPHPIEDNTFVVAYEDGTTRSYPYVNGFYVQEAI